MLKNCPIFTYYRLVFSWRTCLHFFFLVCAWFPRKTGKKCGQLTKLKEILQRFVFVCYIPLGITFFTAFKPIVLFISLKKWASWSGLGLSGLHMTNLSWQTHVGELKLACVKDTTIVGKHVDS